MLPTAEQFLEYAKRDYQGSSPLYEFLALKVANDSELLEIASHGQNTAPHLFFAAVQHLLMQSNNEPLAQYYPNFQKAPKQREEMFPVFRSFCLDNRGRIIDIVSSRIVQTNEVSRCSYLYPAFAAVSRIEGGKPLAMIDLGTSAGLHLLFDLYCYDYKLHGLYGDLTSPVRIESEFRGNNIPHLPESSPAIASRVGIDINPIRRDQTDEIAWLEALIWPEHEARRRLFKNAVGVLEQEQTRITLFKGDAAEVLPDVLAKIPEDQVPCVFQTHVGRQLSVEAKRKLLTAVEDFARTRKTYLVSARRQLNLERFAADGNRHTWILANYQTHGRWLEWLSPSVIG